MDYQLQHNSQLLKNLLNNNFYEKAIQEANKKYKIKHYRIEKLKPSAIKSLLKKNKKKQRTSLIEQNNYAWGEGQLKIYIWLLVSYVYMKKIDISEMKENDFYFFNEVFKDYTVDFLNYQAKFLLRSNEKVSWTSQQSKLLNRIIKDKLQQKNWNTVAFELYLASDRSVFRTPKQCRERWLNHEDPIRNRSEWTVEEDIQLLRFVKSHGKKWSFIAKSLKSIRTEHMVKNRFASLIRKASKNFKSLTQKQLLEKLIKLKKVERSDKEKVKLEEEEMVDEKNDTAGDLSCGVQKQQFFVEAFDERKQKQNGLQYSFPDNLVLEVMQQLRLNQLPTQGKQIIDFFEKDHVYPTMQFMDWFE